jgi:hypothetical protein
VLIFAEYFDDPSGTNVTILVESALLNETTIGPTVAG